MAYTVISYLSALAFFVVFWRFASIVKAPRIMNYRHMLRLTGKNQKVDLTGAFRADLLGKDQESSSEESDEDDVTAGTGAFEN